jgi:hypothetical protein
MNGLQLLKTAERQNLKAAIELAGQSMPENAAIHTDGPSKGEYLAFQPFFELLASLDEQLAGLKGI